MQRTGRAMIKTLEQRQASYEQRITALRQKVRKIEKTKAEQDRRDRSHVGIVIGWGVIEHALQHPRSEVRRVLIDVIEKHLEEQPRDRPVRELLATLREQAQAPTQYRPAGKKSIGWVVPDAELLAPVPEAAE